MGGSHLESNHKHKCIISNLNRRIKIAPFPLMQPPALLRNEGACSLKCALLSVVVFHITCSNLAILKKILVENRFLRTWLLWVIGKNLALVSQWFIRTERHLYKITALDTSKKQTEKN